MKNVTRSERIFIIVSYILLGLLVRAWTMGLMK